MNQKTAEKYSRISHLYDTFEYPIERFFRDARVHQILEGTNEIMRVITARRLLQEDGAAKIR